MEYDFNLKRLTNVANPQIETDAVNKRHLNETILTEKNDTISILSNFYENKINNDFYDKKSLDAKFQSRDLIIANAIVTALNSENRRVNDTKFIELGKKFDALNSSISTFVENFNQQLNSHTSSLNSKYKYLEQAMEKLIATQIIIHAEKVENAFQKVHHKWQATKIMSK